MARTLELPALGQTMEEGTITQWFKSEGEAVTKGEALYEVMTDTIVAVNGQPSVRPMMNLCLSFDHRVTDGAPAAAFLAQLKETLEQRYLMFA